MTGPKHLWSGDWQSESGDLSRGPASPTPPVADPPPDPVPVRRPVRPLWRVALPAMAVALVLGGVVAELVPGGASGHRTSKAASTPTLSIPTPVTPPVLPTPSTNPPSAPGTTVSGPTVNWLGMQISTVANVGVVVQTVQLGSSADAAGLDPGDIIQTVNHRTITAAAEIRSAVANLKPGDAVDISVDRGSTLFSTVALFAGHPTTSP